MGIDAIATPIHAPTANAIAERVIGTPLSQPLGDVGITEPEARVPADGERDHLIREAVATEGRG
jgi:hypothetical protein